MKIIRTLLIVTFFITSVCSSQTNEIVKIYGFDISKDDKTFLMSCRNKDVRSIYTMHCDSVQPKLLIQGDKNLSLFHPYFSPDGKKIVFIGRFNQKVNENAIFIANSDGSNIRQLTSGKEIINQAIFSEYDSSVVLYCRANTFGHYSPIGVDQPHGMDIYSINITDTTIIKKITDLNSYGLYDISEFDSTTLYFYKQGGKEGGMHSFNTKTKKLTRFEPTNHPRASSDLYYVPLYSKIFNVLAFTAPYELYLMDMTSGYAKLIFRNKPTLSGVIYFRFLHNSKKILFIAEREGLLSVNFDGSDLKKINIVLK